MREQPPVEAPQPAAAFVPPPEAPAAEVQLREEKVAGPAPELAPGTPAQQAPQAALPHVPTPSIAEVQQQPQQQPPLPAAPAGGGVIFMQQPPTPSQAPVAGPPPPPPPPPPHEAGFPRMGHHPRRDMPHAAFPQPGPPIPQVPLPYLL